MKYTMNTISKKKAGCRYQRLTQAGRRQARSSFAPWVDCPWCGQLASGAFFRCVDSLKLAWTVAVLYTLHWHKYSLSVSGGKCGFNQNGWSAKWRKWLARSADTSTWLTRRWSLNLFLTGSSARVATMSMSNPATVNGWNQTLIRNMYEL